MSVSRKPFLAGDAVIGRVVSQGMNVSGASSFDTATITTATISQLYGADSWRGVTLVESGDTVSTVSASLVASGYPIQLTASVIVNATDADINWYVNSIVDDTSFAIVGNAATIDNVTVSWTIVR